MKKGDRVKYIGCSEAQYNWGSGKDPRPIFTIDQELRVESVKVYCYETLIKFRGIDGKFNSVCFRAGEK